MLLPVSKIDPRLLSLQPLFSLWHNPPKLRQWEVKSRSKSSFLLVLRGSYHYTYKKGRTVATAGSLLYLPAGASYRYVIPEDDTEALQIEFRAYYAGATEQAVFSEHPVGYSNCGTPVLQAAFRGLLQCQACVTPTPSFDALGFLFLILQAFSRAAGAEAEASCTDSKVAPAIRYLHTHYSKRISIPALAQMCYLSESQFRRLFRAQTGASPAKYKNGLRMQAACELLQTDTLSIGEIASLLEFDSIYAFSQTFRREMGIAPSQYGRKH